MSRTVESPLLPKKSDLAVRVASYKADNDGFFLSALKSVYAAQLDTREFVLEGSQDPQLDC